MIKAQKQDSKDIEKMKEAERLEALSLGLQGAIANTIKEITEGRAK